MPARARGGRDKAHVFGRRTRCRVDVEVRAADLEDILRSKSASNRPQNQQDVILIKQMLKRR